MVRNAQIVFYGDNSLGWDRIANGAIRVFDEKLCVNLTNYREPLEDNEARLEKPLSESRSTKMNQMNLINLTMIVET